MAALLLAVGLVSLTVGAELLVRGASRLARAMGISPLVIGLTVVAFGTSAPELAVGLKAAAVGQVDLLMGNVVGSNIFNILLVLGVSGLIVPLTVSGQLLRLDVPAMIAVSLLLIPIAWDHRISRIEGAILVACFAAYTLIAFRLGRKTHAATQARLASESGADPPSGGGGFLRPAVFVVVGLALLVLGSGWLVDGAVAIARALKVSELIIGLTIVAAGTSLPEAATSVVAAVRGERDIAVGNAVGSNIFNIGAALGLACLISPNAVAVAGAALWFDIPVMCAVAIACLPVFYTDGRISRWEGVFMIGYYVAYLSYLVFQTTHHDELPVFSRITFAFVLVVTVTSMAVAVSRTVNSERKRRESLGADQSL